MRPETGRPASGVPRQFLVRGAMVITGLTLLLIVDVRGVAFYMAWSLIVLALASEAAATLVYWTRSRGRGCAGSFLPWPSRSRSRATRCSGAGWPSGS
jgi:hypothetical protein